MHTNQRVNVLSDDKMENVIIKGINENGYLVAVTDEGKTVELIPDGNTFNFLEGLISKKLWYVCFLYVIRMQFYLKQIWNKQLIKSI